MKQQNLRNVKVQEKNLEQQMNVFKLRIITIPKQIQNFHYYSKQYLLIETQFLNIYSIDGDEIKFNMELTKLVKNQCNKQDQTLYLDNHLIVRSESNLFKFNLDVQSKYEIFSSFPLIQEIYDYKQINRKSFITQIWSDRRLRIYLLKNFKIQNTMVSNFQIDQTSYFNHMVQTRKFQDVYYFNIQMTKQIRKYRRFWEYLHRLDSNYLFVPIFEEINGIQGITRIQIYNICNMKLKGTIDIKNRKEKLHNFIYIKDFNILAVYYPNKYIDLYDFHTLQFQRTQKLNRDYKTQLKYDKENGFILFQMRDIYHKN